ncbi:MAG: hypothetical protein KDH19_06355, partial [Geminicoccaceae bacterium]|nr:hypothetical protein [Geminicoccaceae bacterium]
VDHYAGVLKGLIERHVAATQSTLGDRLLREFDREIGNFWQIVPKELLDKLEVPVTAARTQKAQA